MAYIINPDGIIVFAPFVGGNTFRALDGTGDEFSPFELYGVTSERESANVIQNRIDGGVNVLLRGSRPRSGTLEMVFADDVDAARASGILARGSAFTLTSADRPALDMTFALSGRLSEVIHNEIRDAWEFSVAYQEIVE